MPKKNNNTDNKLTLEDLDIKRSNDIAEEEIIEVDFVIEGLITKGINILSSRPKCGKSTLAFQMALAASLGNNVFKKNNTEEDNSFQCKKKSNVLIISFEESEAKFNKRLKNSDAKSIPNNIYFAKSWPMLESEDGLKLLKDFIKDKQIDFVVIDTYTQFFRGTKVLGSSFRNEYNIISKIKQFADKTNVSILFLHHTTKQENDDWLVSLYGSQALSAAADTILFIRKERHGLNAVLNVTGRDIEDQVFALKFDKIRALWDYVGKSEVFLLTNGQREIYETMLDLGQGGPIKLEDIASNVYKSKSNTIRFLQTLTDMGFVEKTGYGKYKAIKNPLDEEFRKQKIIFNVL
ncbi:MAG: AAA family ATPase [bacterium]